MVCDHITWMSLRYGSLKRLRHQRVPTLMALFEAGVIKPSEAEELLEWAPQLIVDQIGRVQEKAA